MKFRFSLSPFEVLMINKILFALSLVSFVALTASFAPQVEVLPPAIVTVDTELVEIEFVPSHSLYQKRCLVDGELVYCADTGSLATVTVDTEEIEIDFVADAN